MTSSPRNNGRKTPIGRRFQPGNPGRPKGARHKATLAAEALLDGEAEALTRKAIEAGLAGDTIALRLCMDRIVPPRRERPVNFALPPLKTADDAAAAMAAIAAAIADGDVTPGEAAELAKLVELFVKAVQAGEFDRRLKVLEDARDSGERPIISPRISA